MTHVEPSSDIPALPAGRPVTLSAHRAADDLVPHGRAVDTSPLSQLSSMVIRESGRRGEVVEAAGIHPIPRDLELRRRGSEEWLLCRWDDDPVVVRKGYLPLPAPIRRSLNSLTEAGIDFRTVMIAHQTTADTMPMTPAEILRAPAHPVAQEVAARLVRDPAPHPEAINRARRVAADASRARRAVLTGCRALGMGLAGLAVAPLAPLALLDPILFGAVTMPGVPHEVGRPAAWFVLGRWEW